MFVSALSIGEYIPQYDENNDLKPMQCWGSVGQCWCVYGPNAYKVITDMKTVCPPKILKQVRV